MSCERIQPELVGYHFGVIEDATRSEVEAHLLGCPACLRSFVDLKRELETAESGPRPSPALRERLRASAARELGLEPRRWSWWERPLAFGLAGVVVLIAMLAVTLIATGPGAPPHGLGAQRASASPALR